MRTSRAVSYDDRPPLAGAAIEGGHVMSMSRTTAPFWRAARTLASVAGIWAGACGHEMMASSLREASSPHLGCPAAEIAVKPQPDELDTHGRPVKVWLAACRHQTMRCRSAPSSGTNAACAPSVGVDGMDAR